MKWAWKILNGILVADTAIIFIRFAASYKCQHISASIFLDYWEIMTIRYIFLRDRLNALFHEFASIKWIKEIIDIILYEMSKIMPRSWRRAMAFTIIIFTHYVYQQCLIILWLLQHQFVRIKYCQAVLIAGSYFSIFGKIDLAEMITKRSRLWSYFLSHVFHGHFIALRAKPKSCGIFVMAIEARHFISLLYLLQSRENHHGGEFRSKIYFQRDKASISSMITIEIGGAPPRAVPRQALAGIAIAGLVIDQHLDISYSRWPILTLPLLAEIVIGARFYNGDELAAVIAIISLYNHGLPHVACPRIVSHVDVKYE